jgi:hypothetical protein
LYGTSTSWRLIDIGKVDVFVLHLGISFLFDGQWGEQSPRLNFPLVPSSPLRKLVTPRGNIVYTKVSDLIDPYIKSTMLMRVESSKFHLPGDDGGFCFLEFYQGRHLYISIRVSY